ncbi:MAG: haloacid dehalogenase-like hydrolase [Oscillospiraceae bacterium]|nr:haloacid dehalogenase-like hydrolase [Oscillospiraceae bacterium]
MYYLEQLVAARDAAGDREVVVVCDFDGTITTADSDVTMNAMAKAVGYDSSFSQARDELYREYAPALEQAAEGERAALERKWWNGQMAQFLRYPIPPEAYTDALTNLHFELRPEAAELLRYCEENDVPVFIVSAGLGNLIIPILAWSGLLSPNLRVLSNFVRYDGEKAVSYTAPVTPSNKRTHLQMELSAFDHYIAVVYGDKEEDLDLLPPEISVPVKAR